MTAEKTALEFHLDDRCALLHAALRRVEDVLTIRITNLEKRASMNNDRLRAINQQIRDAHLKFHASQGKEIDALRDALDALKASNGLIQELLKHSDDLDAELDRE